MLRLSMLGFPTVTCDGAPVTEFISQKSLVLLCYLVLEPRVHAREALAGVFWSEMSQERALSNLRQALHNLQKLLPGYVTVTRQTVWFETSRPHHTDVSVLDGAESDADILTVYRDGFMAGVLIADAADIEQWISRKREHYSLRYAAVLDSLLADAFARHNVPLAERIARRLIEHDPYRESAYQTLWRVLVQQGRVAQAIASVDALRVLLRDELDLAPSAETQRIARQLAMAQDAARHNIPAAVSPFVGRADDAARIGHLLRQAECRLVTICGIGGVGKSRLAQEFGRTAAGTFLNGAAYVPMGAVTDVAYLHTALAYALGLSLQNVRDPQHEIEAFLAEREMLLIFDNAEHLHRFARWLGALLDAAPYVKVLVTSRQTLNLREEWVVMLDGLPFSEASDTPSVELLVRMAERGGCRIVPDADAAALCALLEGLPLGIELAGALLTADGVTPLLYAVREHLDHVRARWVNAEPHHMSLRAVFQTSWDALSAAEQTALANLAVFESAFSSDAAHAVADADVALLRRLASRSLVREQDSGWSVHAVIRAYAREQQAAPAALAARFEAYTLRLVEQADAEFAARRIPAAVDLLRANIGLVRQLWQMLVVARRLPALVRLSFTMHRFYEGAGLFAEGLAFFRNGIEVLNLNRYDPDERTLLGRLTMHDAGMLLRLGRVVDAAASAQAAVEYLSHDENDPSVLAFALNSLGVAQLYKGEMDAARRTLEQCADIYRQLELPELLKPLVNLGAIYSRTGDTEQARAVLLEARGVAQHIGDAVGGFHIANSLGLNHMLHDQYADALRYFEEALGLSETTGFLSGKAIVLNNLGDVTTLIGQPQAGARYAEDAVALARQLQDQRGLVYSLTTLTLAQLALRQPAASATLREALQLAREAQAAPLMTTVLYAAGEWYASVGQGEQAGRLWQIVAHHPAAEMDYRRRAVRCLGETPRPADNTAPPLADIIEMVIAQLV